MFDIQSPDRALARKGYTWGGPMTVSPRNSPFQSFRFRCYTLSLCLLLLL